MQVTDIRVRGVEKEGKMKAVVSITIDNEFVVHDIKVIQGDKGLFIAMPSRKAADGEYRDIAHPINTETRERLQRMILEKYQESLEAFCIMGGIFSEGIDLLGEKLIGAILVGTGLPQLGNEREILRSFYTENGENGFDYAYRYPGMNKVLQAAGRVIRTKEDHGVILLFDERFRQREYSNLFPVEWNDRKTCTLSNVEAQLQKFWESIPDKISHKL